MTDCDAQTRTTGYINRTPQSQTQAQAQPETFRSTDAALKYLFGQPNQTYDFNFTYPMVSNSNTFELRGLAGPSVLPHEPMAPPAAESTWSPVQNGTWFNQAPSGVQPQQNPHTTFQRPGQQSRAYPQQDMNAPSLMGYQQQSQPAPQQNVVNPAYVDFNQQGQAIPQQNADFMVNSFVQTSQVFPQQRMYPMFMGSHFAAPVDSFMNTSVTPLNIVSQEFVNQFDQDNVNYFSSSDDYLPSSSTGSWDSYPTSNLQTDSSSSSSFPSSSSSQPQQLLPLLGSPTSGSRPSSEDSDVAPPPPRRSSRKRKAVAEPPRDPQESKPEPVKKRSRRSTINVNNPEEVKKINGIAKYDLEGTSEHSEHLINGRLVLRCTVRAGCAKLGSLEEVEQHRVNVHPNEYASRCPYKCAKMGSQTDLVRHWEIALHQVPAHGCRACAHSFTRKDALTRHHSDLKEEERLIHITIHEERKAAGVLVNRKGNVFTLQAPHGYIDTWGKEYPDFAIATTSYTKIDKRMNKFA